ncbi:MAG: amidophosphoribosyltransferase [Candidatus Saccharimonadales bacterium]
MCGIVGLLLKDALASPPLGELLVPMFDCMAERGPDSAGLAVFGTPLPESSRRYCLFAADKNYDWLSLTSRLSKAVQLKCGVAFNENHATIGTDAGTTVVSKWLTENEPALHLLSAGRSIEVYKDEGHPLEIARRYRFATLTGTHCVGHTRMATESAVSPAHAHPFTAGEDFCLVHNGSLSNPYMLRRKLERKGLTFETDNDTEAACRFIEWRLRQGDSIHQALEASLRELDGFYTLLIATAHEMTLLRDAFACKPAVVAETDQYVAISSEFRSLAHLPGVADAQIFEPMPEEIYTWSV